MGQGGSVNRGVGKALAEERVRAEIAVKLHLAIGDRQNHRAVLEAAFRASDADGSGEIDFNEFCACMLKAKEQQYKSGAVPRKACWHATRRLRLDGQQRSDGIGLLLLLRRGRVRAPATSSAHVRERSALQSLVNNGCYQRR